MIKSSSLPDFILDIVKNKKTERPFTGEYNDFGETGSYLCRQCGLALFRSNCKFHSGCGWPSFDAEIEGAVLHLPDADKRRTEILCARCHGHLGHIFSGEGFTSSNKRYCVNSLSLDFISEKNVTDTEEAIVAAGCFWGVEALFKKLPGVLKTEVGYTGGRTSQPSYQDICKGSTGHYEALRVLYNPSIVTYEKILQHFFEIHDPSQANGQGPDIGQQYQSAIFYYDQHQKDIAMSLIDRLKKLGFSVATQLLPVSPFWRAEEFHQDYYRKTNKEPYCHRHEKKNW